MSAAVTVETLRDRAYAALGVTREQVWAVPCVTPQIRQQMAELRRADRTASDGRRTPSEPIYYVNCSDDPEARRFREAWYTLPKSHRKIVPLEAYCVAAGISPIRLLSIIAASIVRLNASASAVLAASAHPRVVRKTIEMAMTDYGEADRATLHKAVGFLPTPKGTQISINATANAQAQAAAAAAAIPAPPPEATIRRLAERLNAARGLPAAQPSALSAVDAASALPSPAAEVIQMPTPTYVSRPDDSGWDDADADAESDSADGCSDADV